MNGFSTSANLNANKSPIIYPETPIFTDFNQQHRAGMKIFNGLFRLSAGIEDVDDLIDDKRKGLKAL